MDTEKNNENNFFEWLSGKVKPSEFSKLKKVYQTISVILIQKKVLTKPIAEVQTQRIIDIQKKVRFFIGSKQLRYYANRILTYYLDFLNTIREVPKNAKGNNNSLDAFMIFLLEEKHLAKRTAENYYVSIRKIEDYIRENRLDFSVIDATPENIHNVISTLMGIPDFVKINDQWHHQFSAAMNQYADFLCRGLDVDEQVVQIRRISGRSSKRKVSEEKQDLATIKKAETMVMNAGIDGITFDELAANMEMSVSGVKKVVQKSLNIVNICGRQLHKESFINWDDIAEKMDDILEKLMLRNNGYVSDVQLYEYAHLEMRMFLNDNDLDDQRKVYDLAEHLFSKENWNGQQYIFSSKTHISRKDESLSSKRTIIQKFARDQGGFFRKVDLETYLQSLGIKTSSMWQQMKAYDKPIFLFYEHDTYISTESIGIDDTWLRQVRIAVDNLFADVGDHIVLRDIQPWWFAMLPKLPGERPWTPLLLQCIATHYEKEIGARAISGLTTQTRDTLSAMLVSVDSEIQTFGDAVLAVLIEEGIDQRKFEAEELRQFLVRRGLISGNELFRSMPKALPRDDVFIWDAAEEHVTINF